MLKHTASLMKIRPPANAQEKKANKDDREKTLNGLATKLRLVHDLAQTDGWKFFISELQDEEIRMLAMLERATDPTTIAKVAGSLLVVKSFIDWPGHMARQLEASARDINDDNEG